MSTVYDEGPYNNWSAISFPAGSFDRAIYQDFTTSHRFLFLAYATEDPADGLAEGLPQDHYKKIIIGSTSGTTLDLRNLPFTSGVPLIPVFPTWANGCDPGSGSYTTKTGGSVGPAPYNGYVRYGESFRYAEAYATGSWIMNPSPPPENCLYQSDRPSLPAFIHNEFVTMHDEYPE